MTLSAFVLPAIAGAVGLGLAVFCVLVMKAHREHLAWGSKPALTFRNRREIRQAVKKGRRVADPDLAAPTVRLAEEFQAADARLPKWLRGPSRGIQLTSLILFGGLGTASLLTGIYDDTAGIVYGVVLYLIGVTYLPFVQRRTYKRRDLQRTRWQAAITANSAS